MLSRISYWPHSEFALVLRKVLLSAQGEPVDIGGYYQPDAAKCTAAMRPSATFNAIVDGL